jgi:hypothetical protein
MSYDIIVGRDSADKKAFGDRGLVYIGKGYVKMGRYTSLSNKIFMDISRSHVVLVAGKRGCLEGNTLIFTNEGYKKIKYFDKDKDKILSFDKKTKKFEWENAELLKYPLEKEDMLKIELDDGRELILTKEHPLLSSYGKYTYWRKAEELKISDKIVIPLNLPEIKNDGSLRLARLLGYILADGNINIRKGVWKDGRGYMYNGTKARIRIFNADNGVLSQAKKDFEGEFGIYAKRYIRNDCNCEVVQILQQPVVNKFVSLGIPEGNKSGIIRIPEIVFQSSNEFKAQFINALFSCDGYVPKTGRYIDYSSKSKGFLQDLQLLLSHFQIESSIRLKISKLNGKEFSSYRLFVTDNKSIEKFKKIGSIIKFKKDRLNEHKINNTRKRKTHYIEEDLVCRKIKSISIVSEVEEVFDLSVPKNHSFIANGIISHNSGKSYTLGVIAEELSALPKAESQNIGSLIFDTMGIYWTMKFKNEKDKDLLSEWDLKQKNLPVRVFVPFGHYDSYLEKGIPADSVFALDVNEMAPEDWVLTFGLDMINPISVLIQRTLTELKEKGRYNIDDILQILEEDKRNSQDVRNAATGLFEAANTWGIFAKSAEDSTKIEELITAGTTSILDLSVYNAVGAFNVRALVISLISRKIFNQRMSARKEEEVDSVARGLEYLSGEIKKENPLVWIFIDEAHEFLPLDGKTAATDALIQLLREGRQPGISLVLATQQPGQIHHDVMTQSDIIISHRVTSKPDTEALNYIMQSYILESIKKQMDDLPSLKGSAILLDDNSERIYPIRVRPRFTWHGGEAPTAIRADKSL